MSKFSKLARLAQEALNKSGSTNQSSGSGQTDWRSVVRSAADSLTGDARAGDTGRSTGVPATSQARSAMPAPPNSSSSAASVSDADRVAIARYDYLLETADPRQIEQVHREAFGRLTPAQRDAIQRRMDAELPEHERPRTSDPDALARAATRTEATRPGFLRGLLARAGNAGSGSGGGLGRGAMVGGAAAGVGLAAGGVLAAVAGGAVLSSVAGPLLEQAANIGVDFTALGEGLDADALTGGLSDAVSGAGDTVSGFGDQVSDLGSGFTLPGLDDIFGR